MAGQLLYPAIFIFAAFPQMNRPEQLKPKNPIFIHPILLKNDEGPFLPPAPVP
jgi:hypothetical protein